MSDDFSHALEAFTRRRDERSFRLLYRAHTPALYAMAMRLTGSRDDAEELTQQTWVNAVSKHDQFQHRASYRSWVTGILINCFRRLCRERSRAMVEYDDNRNVIAVHPSRNDEALDVGRALLQLSPGYREVIVLHDIHGYTHEEIATLLDIAPGTSKSQLQRGRIRLRQLLKAPRSTSISEVNRD